MDDRLNLEAVIDFGYELVEQSSAIIRADYGSVDVAFKADQSPVTVTDRQVEQVLRTQIVKKFPQHKVIGEEYGVSGNEDSAYEWILDPIDGTLCYVHGVPLFTTLIALVRNKKPILGIIAQPILNQVMVGAEGRQTVFNGQPVSVSDTKQISDASMAYTSYQQIIDSSLEAEVRSLMLKTKVARGWGDAYGHMLVAMGKLDVAIEPSLALWDIAALGICVVGAGGDFYNWDGGTDFLGSSAISSNKHLKPQILDAIKSANNPKYA